MLNIPNLLTVFRILASFVFLYFGLCNRWDMAFPIFCFAAATDLVDGSIARILGQRTPLGAFLDPMADKLLMFFSVVCLTIYGFLPVLLTAIIVGRDLVIVLGLAYLKYRRVNILYRPTYLSKLTTFLQILTVFAALILTQKGLRLGAFVDVSLLERRMMVLVMITGLATLVTGGQYIRIGRRMLRDAKA